MRTYIVTITYFVYEIMPSPKENLYILVKSVSAVADIEPLQDTASDLAGSR
mgnify:CR=1 FL=1